MLVLTRKKLQSVQIGDDIEVTVLEVTGNRVRLGFKCPPHVSVMRTEKLQNAEFEFEMPVESRSRELAIA